MRLLTYCGVLATGEFLASFVPTYAEIWPLVAILALLVGLFGYGLGCRYWGQTVLFLLGASLFLHASVALEQKYREKPWARGREWLLRSPEKRPDAMFRVRREFSRRIGIGLSGDNEIVALSRAILLGERKRLPCRTKRLFCESGTMHVFAISGLHVMAIGDLLAVVLALSFVPRRFVGLLVIPLLWCYVVMIGFSPSAVRAAMMATFSFLAPVFWRKPDGLRSWALTFLVVHLADPKMIVNVGNALSFAVMLAIVLVGRHACSLARWKQALLVTVAAWAAGVPIAAYVFGCVTPGGMLANLFLIATAKLTVVAGAAGVAISYLSETVARHFNNLSALGIRAMVLVAEGTSRLPGANLKTGSWPLAVCLCWYVMLAMIAFGVVRSARRRRML